VRFPAVVLHLVLERRNTVTKNISEPISVKLKKTREDPWLFFGGGAAVVLYAVLTILASALRAPEESSRDSRVASTPVSIPQRNVPAPAFGIEKRGASVAAGVAPQ
jgi:hypothetical protein